MNPETMVKANGVALCAQTFGAPGNHAILLIGGAASSMDYWPEEFCARLAELRRFVIRYDSRDTGRSVSYPPGAPGYTFRDLAGDAIGLLDAFGIGRAHLVGISMGGGIAQVIGVEQPHRVATLTLIATSPGGPGPDNGLPAMAPELRAHFAAPPPEPDWTDRAAVIDYMVNGDKVFAGSPPPDEAELLQRAAKIVDRTINIRSSLTNHWIIDGGGEPVRPRLGEITAPTLVIHGTADPLFPYGHAESLAGEIPGARLLPLAGAGHEVPPRATWDAVITALVAHTN